MLERIGSVGKWKCVDCNWEFISEQRRPSRCPRQGCRALANSRRRKKKAKFTRLHPDPALVNPCKRCGIRESRPDRTDCIECAQERRETQKAKYWRDKMADLPPDIVPLLISS